MNPSICHPHLTVESVKLFSPTALNLWFTPAEPSDCRVRSKLLMSVTVILPNLQGGGNEPINPSKIMGKKMHEIAG